MKKVKQNLKVLSKTCLTRLKGGGLGNGKAYGYQKWNSSDSASASCCPPPEPSDNL